VTNALSSHALPVDPKGVYFVLTAPYVAETSGFLTLVLRLAHLQYLRQYAH
jgi:hypothetical protein